MRAARSGSRTNDSILYAQGEQCSMILKQVIRMNRFSLVNQKQLREHCDPFPNYNDIKMY